MSLRRKAVTGLAWTFGQQVGTQGLNFIVSILLARRLMPEEFGIIGMLAIFIAIGNSLIDSGLTSSLIRTANPDQHDYSTVFFTNLLGSVLVYCIIFFSAPLISDFFGHEILIPVIRVYCLTFIIRALAMVQHTRLTKLMNFKTQLIIALPSLLGGGIAGLILAYKGFGVWSLVWMNIVQSTLSTIQLWIHSKWRPSLIFDIIKFKYHFNFGYKMTLSGLLDTIYSNIYHIIIGKYFSAVQLGYYTRAQSMRQLPVNNISAALNKVTYPLFSGIQEDSIRLKSLYKRLMQQVVFWLAPTLIIAGILAEPIFRFLLTEKWLPAVPYFQILCFLGITYPLHSYNLNILKVKGRSDLFLRLEIVKKVLITITIFVVIKFGIYGLLWGQVAIDIIGFFINTHYSGKLINYKVSEQLRDILPILGLACLCGLLCFSLNIILTVDLDWMRIAIISTLSMLSYIGVAFSIKLPPISDFKNLVLQR